MGKVYKRKKACCGQCKPHKRGGAPRYTAKEIAKRKQLDKEMNYGTQGKED